MRLSLPTVILVCAVFSCALPVCGARAAVETPAGGRAALVNGALITREAFDNELKRVERLNLRRKRPGAAANGKQVLENLIVRELLYQEALRLRIRVSSGEVAARVAELSGRLSGEAALESALDSMGLSPGALETQIERGMVIEKYLKGNSRGAAVSEDQVNRYYQDHQDEFREPLRLRLSHILIKTDLAWDDTRKEAAHSRIAELGKRLSGGEDFAALAREASECYSAKSGGDLGYFLPGQLAKKMEDEARALKAGEVSGVVEDRYGLHLLKVTELRPAAIKSLDQVRGAIRARFREEQELKALAPVVKRLRAAAKVEILLNENE